MFRTFALFSFFASLITANYAQAVSEKIRTGVVPVNDIRMYYEISGKGEPLILLHGGLGSTSNWKGQIPELSKHFMVIAADSRGHGRSTFSDKQISYALMASDVLALMERLKISRANILGWSDGGIIGIILAIRHPERLRRVVAFGANYDPAGLRPGFEESPKIKEHIEHAAAEYQQISPEPKRWDAFLANVSTMWANEPKLTEDELKSIRVPVLILDGQDDEGILTEHTRKMAGLIPNSKLVLIPGTGHFAPAEKPAEFNRQVLSFLMR
jgi:pimeloyl-ACP methyl ester carboxylesterase